ncbi:flagellar biosynthetic protein FliO [Taklimakanibacter lacteus]|uniref:flagellar biosynthetic protein FliO n=1 Tax=Taklimakanibacter lacteus TaxID=2268456 RepID=UPI000E662246
MDVLTAYWSYIVGAVIILAVLVLLFVVVRSLGGRVRGGKGARLGISEYHEIDKDRRLVLVRRDDYEHLVLIGGAQDVVIETGIPIGFDRDYDETFTSRPLHAEPAEPRRSSRAERDEHAPIPLRAAPRPPVFGEKRPVLRTIDRGEPQLGPQDRDYGPDDRV